MINASKTTFDNSLTGDVREMCFIDISEAFDKVWSDVLLIQIQVIWCWQ